MTAALSHPLYRHMAKSKRRRIVTLLVCVVLAVLAMAVFTPPREPSYGGRTLSQWLEICRSAGVGRVPLEQSENAADAVRAIGTNALPFLVQWIRYEPNPGQQKLRRKFTAIGWIRDAIALGRDVNRSSSAKIGFMILGPTARPAVPELIRIINDTNCPLASSAAFGAIVRLGEDAILPVAEALTNANHSQHRSGPWAASQMSYMGTNASSLVPLLAECAKDGDWSFAYGAVTALGSLRLLPEISVPVLANCLTHSNASIRQLAANNLRQFKSAARPALPALIAAREDPDKFVRHEAAKSISVIAPDSLTNAAIAR